MIHVRAGKTRTESCGIVESEDFRSDMTAGQHDEKPVKLCSSSSWQSFYIMVSNTEAGPNDATASLKGLEMLGLCI